MNFFEKSKCCVCSKSLQKMFMSFFSQCKRCHQDVCLSCSNNRIKLYAIPNEMVKQFDKTQRVCDNCYRDYLYYQDLIKVYKLQWNTKSLFINKLMGDKKRKIKIQQPLEFFDKQNIEKDILTGRSDAHLLNYSVREFVTQCQQGLEQTQIRNSIINVLQLFVAHNPTIGYCQGMNYIAIICLCIADEEGAFLLMNHLFNVIIPPRFFSNSSGASLIGYQAEINFLQEQIFVNDFKNNKTLTQFIELQGPQLLLTLMVQVLNISSLLVTWIQMFKLKSFVPIDKVLLYTLNTAIRDIDLMQPKILNNIGKFVHYANLIELFQKDEIYFTKFERTIYIEQYYSKISRQWVKNDPIILNKLKKISNLEIDEIINLQTEFKKHCLEKRTIEIDQQQRQSMKQIAQLTDSSDEDGDDQYRETLIIQQFKLQKYGINLNTFLNLMVIHLIYIDFVIINQYNHFLFCIISYLYINRRYFYKMRANIILQIKKNWSQFLIYLMKINQNSQILENFLFVQVFYQEELLLINLRCFSLLIHKMSQNFKILILFYLYLFLQKYNNIKSIKNFYKELFNLLSLILICQKYQKIL